jgi:hypothetical protein
MKRRALLVAAMALAAGWVVGQRPEFLPTV